MLATNFPDPFLLRTERRFLAFSTQSAGVHVQVAASPDLLTWTLLSRDGGQLDAMPTLPAWAHPDRPDVWAPEVIRVGSGWRLYFSARHRTERNAREAKPCIGVAAASAPEGPYTPAATPLICEGLREGVIDPSPFRDGLRLFLLFKRDGNCCGGGSNLLVQQLTRDGLRTVGPRRDTGVRNDLPWKGEVVEAPTLVRHRGRRLLFYSANGYGGPSYAVGYAVCRTAIGPCRDAPDNPVLASRQAHPPRLIGPGHQSLLQWKGRTFIAYHAWSELPDGRQGPARYMHVSEVVWDGDKPVVVGLRRPLPTPLRDQKAGPAPPASMRR